MQLESAQDITHPIKIFQKNCFWRLFSLEQRKYFSKILIKMQPFFILLSILGLFLIPAIFAGNQIEFDDTSNADDDWRIVNGVAAEVGEYPPMVFLSIDLGEEQDGCGASIINANYILSAGHCCVLLDNYTHEAIAGVHNTRQPDENWQRRTISSFQLHPNFTWAPSLTGGDHAVYDLCVLKLSAPLDLDSDRLGVAQFTRETVPAGNIVTLYGWGRTSYEGSRSPILLKANFSVVSFDQCNEIWEGAIVEEAMLCVIENGKSPCHGDSGGPLIWYPADGQSGPFQVGVVSWGYACGQPGFPGMFGDVTKNLDWILEAASEDLDELE